MPEYYGYVYLTVNKVNNKGYVGQKLGMFNKYYYGSGTVFKKALKKYGKENFDRQILVYCSSQEELDREEIYHIDVYRRLYPYKLYNIAKGGGGGGYPVSEETKKKVSITVELYKTYKAKHKEFMIERSRERKKRDKALIYQYKSGKDIIYLMSKYGLSKIAVKDILKQCKEKVICIETGKIYKTVAEAMRDSGVKSDIGRACRNKRKTAGGYHWKYI